MFIAADILPCSIENIFLLLVYSYEPLHIFQIFSTRIKKQIHFDVKIVQCNEIINLPLILEMKGYIKDHSQNLKF